MRLSIEINLENAAFFADGDCAPGAQAAREAERIIADLFGRLDARLPYDGVVLRDVNGNNVGLATVIE